MQHFQTAKLRLTILFTGLLMLVSLSCSVWLYNTAGREIDFVGSEQATAAQTSGFPSSSTVKVAEELPKLLNESHERVLHNLLFFNLIIFGGGILLSYALAQRTLRPIHESYQRQQQFAANASHQLRTPLTTLKAELQVALRRPEQRDDVETNRVLTSSLEEVNRLTALTSKLLRLTQPMQKVSPEQAELQIVAHRAQKRLAVPANEKAITLRLAVPPLHVRIAADELLELLTILLENAVKYSPERTVVTLTACKQRGHISILVEDMGPGIADADLTHIFERFYRARHSPVPGNGLGLAIAHDIVRAARGSIAVHNNPSGCGVTFTVRLPT